MSSFRDAGESPQFRGFEEFILLDALVDPASADNSAVVIDEMGRRRVWGAIPTLIKYLDDGRPLPGSDNWVGGHASNALEAITGQHFGIDRQAWERWWATQPGHLPPAPTTQAIWHFSTPVHYADQAVIISTARGVAIVRFTDPIPEGRKYVYRFLATGAVREVKGEGSIFENNTHRRTAPQGKEAEGAFIRWRTNIVAGRLALEWSLGGEEFGYVYYSPEAERVQMVSVRDFDTLELARFAK